MFPLQSCDVILGAILSEESIPAAKRAVMEDLFKIMQSSIIEQLPLVLESVYLGTMIDIGYAVQSVHLVLTKSRSSFKNEGEACKSSFTHDLHYGSSLSLTNANLV